MNYLVLRMHGVELMFQRICVDRATDAVSYNMSVRFSGDIDARIPDRECFGSIGDMQRMSAYIRSHIGGSEPHDIQESDVFVTYGLEFQIQGLCGSIISLEDGEFALQVMTYCGPKSRESSPIYIGVQSQVDVSEALRWCDELDLLIKS